jgi:hypothetical protein
MTSDRVNRHQAQKEKIKVLREHREETAQYRIQTNPSLTSATDSTPTDDALERLTRRQQQEIEEFNVPVTVTVEDADALITELRSKWSDQQTNQLLGDCRKAVLNSVIGPFGLGSIVAAMDKNGGNVTTNHNAKQGVYARTEEEYVRTDYAGYAYEKSSDQYKDKAIIENAQMIQDEYTGDYLDYSQVDCDHIKPTNKYHQEGGWRQSKQTRKEFGADSGNFAMTSSSGNRSLGDKEKRDWQEKVATDKSGQTNKDRYGHDNRRVNAAVARGEKTAEKHSDSMTQKAIYDGGRAAVTGATEAGKMGLQQSIGLLLTEFFSASFDEISDSYKNGFRDSLENQKFFDALKMRLGRIAERVAARWKDALIAFKEGAISGFLSNLVTMLINMLVTTGKRIVRVIREGFMSILKALKMALFPPTGMTRAEAGDAALKLLATGITVSLGILAEEVVEKSVTAFLTANMPPLAPLASTVSAVLVGAITGIATALVVSALDKLDLFGVQDQRKHTAILKELDGLIAEGDRNIQSMYQDEMGRMDVMLMKLQGA